MTPGDHRMDSRKDSVSLFNMWKAGFVGRVDRIRRRTRGLETPSFATDSQQNVFLLEEGYRSPSQGKPMTPWDSTRAAIPKRRALSNNDASSQVPWRHDAQNDIDVSSMKQHCVTASSMVCSDQGEGSENGIQEGYDCRQQQAQHEYHHLEEADKVIQLVASGYTAAMLVVGLAAMVQASPNLKFGRDERFQSQSSMFSLGIFLFFATPRLLPFAFNKIGSDLTLLKKGRRFFHGTFLSALAVLIGAVVVDVVAVLAPSQTGLLGASEWVFTVFFVAVVAETIVSTKETLFTASKDSFRFALSTASFLLLSRTGIAATALSLLLTLASMLSLVSIAVILYQRLITLGTQASAKSVTEFTRYQSHRASLHMLFACSALGPVLAILRIYPSLLGTTDGWSDPKLLIVGHCMLGLVMRLTFIFLMTDLHDFAFDSGAMVTRSTEDLQGLISLTWEDSPDILAISRKSSCGKRTSTVINPSYFKLLQKPVQLFDENQQQHRSSLLVQIEQQDGSSERDQDGVSVRRISSSSGSLCIPTLGLRAADHYVNGNVGGSPSISRGGLTDGEIESVSGLVRRAWECENQDPFIMHNLCRKGSDAYQAQFEAKISRVDDSTLIIVARDVDERFRRFEEEKRTALQETAREKDAEANRFTRHEVKNGLLAGIGLCDSLRETSLEAIQNAMEGQPVSERAKLFMVKSDITRSVTELDKTLHEVLDTILSETMTRDVVHGVYEPKPERVDMEKVLGKLKGYSASTGPLVERFPVVTMPDPLPAFFFDPHLLKGIHKQAVSNACKYGKKGGVVRTEVNYSSEEGVVTMRVCNTPGDNHEEILKLGSSARDIVFSAGRTLHNRDQNETNQIKAEKSHSSGDGAWIMQKCATALGGECNIEFEPDHTIFTLRCPATPFDIAIKSQTSLDPSLFQLPERTWGIGIDDSKIQRKLLERLFRMAGIKPSRTIVLGQSADEIRGFNDFVVGFIENHTQDYFFLIVDENLDLEDDSIGHSTVSGSLCVQGIRRLLMPEDERRLLALVRSANDSSHDIAVYNSRAHGSLPKAPLKKHGLAELLAPLWEKRYSRYSPENEAVLRSSFSSIATSLADENLVNVAELMDIVNDVDDIVALTDNLSEKWPLIWEKLFKLKGDILTVEDNKGVVGSAVEMIGAMRGPNLPESFLAKWAEVREIVTSM